MVRVFLRFCAMGAAAATIAMGANADEAPPVGDVVAGERIFKQCVTCHTFDPEALRQGPHLLGVWGRVAGSVEGARYSSAMKDSGIVWDDETLGAYLLDPRGEVPGTTMMIGLRRASDLPDLLAYMKAQSGQVD